MIYAVVEKRRDGKLVIPRNAQRDLMVYGSVRAARTAVKLHGWRGDVEEVRIIPFDCEGNDLETAWEEYEHMEVFP